MDPSMFAYLLRRMTRPPQPISIKIDLSAIRDLFDQKKITDLETPPPVEPMPVAVTNQLPSVRPG